MDLNTQIDWFSQHRPSHLIENLRGNCPELNLGNGGHGEEIAIGYRLTCECGNQSFSVFCYFLPDTDTLEDTPINPVYARCSACKQKLLVFDGDHHGYDPIACDTPIQPHGARETNATLRELAAGIEPTSVDLVFYFPDDLFSPEFNDVTDRRRDLYTWLRIVISNLSETERSVLDFECA